MLSDVVIMDLTVPGGMSGKDAVRELPASDPSAKVVVSSGITDYGFRDVTAKPYDAPVLSRTPARVLSQRQDVRPSLARRCSVADGAEMATFSLLPALPHKYPIRTIVLAPDLC